jgi:hypothetical protein
MNLNEALQILKNNNYLVETLNPKYTDLWNVFRELNLEYGMKEEYLDAWENNVGELYIDISNITDSKDFSEGEIESCALYTVTTQVLDATDEQIEKFLNKHSYHLRRTGLVNKETAEVTYYVEAINTETVYPKTNEKFSHLSETGPEMILKTGLRCRSAKHKNTKFKKYENWYGERIYLTKITPGFERRLDQLAGEAEQAKEEWYNQENPDPTNEPDIKKLYCYEIKLPNTFPLHQDPEYGKNRYYVNQNIPPEFIKYTNWIEVLA